MMRIEKLIDLMLQKVIIELNCSDYCISKCGNPKEDPMMKIKYEVHLKDEEMGEGFRELWDKEIANLGVDYFPLYFGVSSNKNGEYVLIDFLNWCTFIGPEYEIFIDIANKASSLYNLQGSEDSDLKECVKGVQFGSLGLYRCDI